MLANTAVITMEIIGNKITINIIGILLKTPSTCRIIKCSIDLGRRSASNNAIPK